LITEKAMLAAVHISVWTATKHDRQVSREIATQHGAHENAGRYNKKLLQQAGKLEAIRTLAGQIRAYFYQVTLPWSDEGYRILPANLYFELSKKMAEFERGFHTAVNLFLAEYPSYVEQMRPALSGLFRAEDYPDPAKIKEKFELKLEILPIPSGDDFRVALSEEQRARISREIDANVREALNQGTRDLWLRLRRVVEHMISRLNESEGRLYASVVDNIAELVEVLPRLNIANDPDLNSFIEEIKIRLCAYSAKELKHNELLRTTTAQEAADIARRMSAFLDPPANIPLFADQSAKRVSAIQPDADDIFSRMSGYMASNQQA
jgi:hypothetical protein